MRYSTMIGLAILALGITGWAYAESKKGPTDRQRIEALEKQVQALQVELEHVHQEDINVLFQRTNDLRGWLEQLAKSNGPRAAN